MLYEDTTEILEALDFDLAHGGRDWVGGYHKRDLIALGEALYRAQRGPVRWKSKVYGDPFGKDFEARLAELMIEPRRRGTPCIVAPSYYTYRPSMQYLLEAVTHFYVAYLPERFRIPGVRHERRGQDMVIDVFDGHDWRTMATLPTRHEYENGPRMRAELMRTLCQCNEAVVLGGFGSYNNRRDYFVYAMEYVDELWGMHSAAA